MISELFKKCVEQCYIHSISKDGELCLRCCKYDECVYQHERIVLFGEETKAKMSFKDFVEIFNTLKKFNFVANDYNIKLTVTKNNAYQHSKPLSVSFLNFCIRNNIFKDWCIFELKKELNKRFEK